MKKNVIKYLSISLGLIIILIIYFSLIGIQTDRFNNQIKDRLSKYNSNLDVNLKKIKLTLDPLNFKFNAKTIGAKVIYKKRNIELESIKTQISINSLIKNKIVSSNLIISTKSVLLKDLVGFLRATTNKTELFFLEKAIDKGFAIIDLEINFDENGNIKKDYKVKGLLKDGKINLLNDFNIKNINLLLNIENNNFDFSDISFTTNKIDLFSNNLKIKRKQDKFFISGDIENNNSKLNNKFLNLLRLSYHDINFNNVEISSKNKFSFIIDNRFNYENLFINSEISLDKAEYKKPKLLSKYLTEVKNVINLRKHKIKATFKDNNLSLIGSGKIQLEKEYDDIDYSISQSGDKVNIDSNIKLSGINIKSQKNLKTFFPKINEVLNLKDHQINIKFKDNNLSLIGSGKIQLEKEYDDIDYSISQSGDKVNFDTKFIFKKTQFEVERINFSNDGNSKLQLEVSGNHIIKNNLSIDKLLITTKNDKFGLSNLLIDKYHRIVKFDEISLNYFDNEDKKNQILIKRKQKNNYELNGTLFNANSLISDLLKSKDDKHARIFKNNINFNLNLKDVYLDNENVISDLKGNFYIENNKIHQANISAFFDNNNKLTFTINTNNDEKITTLFSSKAKPLVQRYKFVKGYEEGYLDFYSSKINNNSKSKLKIYDFKLKELPVLTKLLTLASLQGIADLLSGEGIRFDEMEMNFKNSSNLMTIDELYAIGPAISILMSGYVEEDKLVSLRGTLVPATTINKTVSSIPVLGKILVGDKTGEGVFGVSFKIKGKPKDLKTTVNPIKTLTPRFITRTLEKIKNN
jgi:ribosomal protein S18